MKIFHFQQVKTNQTKMSAVAKLHAICFIFLTFVVEQTIAKDTKVLRELAFDGGTAGTSSGVNPAAAFKRDMSIWLSGHGTGEPIPYPHHIWYDFVERRVFPKRVLFHKDVKDNLARKEKYKDNGPTKWEFVGSNDSPCNQFSAWTVLCDDYSGKNYTNASSIKFCDVEGVTNGFRCLGISVLNTACQPHLIEFHQQWRLKDLECKRKDWQPQTAISIIRMWEKGQIW